jgi:methyl-accepting chemotaxis protein
MLTQEDKEEIARIFDNGIGKDIRLIRIAMEQVDAKMEEQNEIITGIMDVVESHTQTINQLEEVIKETKKAMQS